MFYTSITRLTVTVKVSPADPDGLRRTFETANAACDWIREQAWHHQTFRQLALDKLVYYPVRELFGLSAQMAVRGIAKVVDVYALDKRTKLLRAVDLFEQSFGQLAAFHFRCALRGSLRDVTRNIV